MGSGKSPIIKNSKSYGLGDAFNNSVDKLGKKIKNLKKERAYWVDSKGNVLYEVQGDKHSVVTPKEIKRDIEKRIWQDKEGIGYVHNHPSGGTFSSSDIESFVSGGYTEFHAVTNAGTYKLKRLKGSRNWDMKFATEASDLQNKLYFESSKIARKVANKKSFKTNGEKIKFQSDYENRYIENGMHNFYKKNAKKYGFVYELKK